MDKKAVSSQWKLSIGFSLFIIMLILFLIQVSLNLALIFAISLALGFTLQKSRFCFTSAFRDPLLIGSTALTEAIILILAISIPGFAVLANLADMMNLPLSLYVTPIGIRTIVGGILFGIGMVMAGGCASGILLRIGEGFQMQMVAFVGVMIGALLGKLSLPFWRDRFVEIPGIFLPDRIGWLPAVALQLLILFFLWKITRWWKKKQKGVG